jgi:aminocarboxymuconate-semialdehyde decarboxylase
MFSIDNRLREMDRLGIDMRVLSLSAPNVYDWRGRRQIEVTRAINDVVASMCRAHPDRFSGLGSLPLDDPEESLREIDRVTGELGFKGVVIGSSVGAYPVNHPRFEPIWARINALKLPVFEHPMLPANIEGMEEFELPIRVGFIFETTLAATRLIYSGIFERYSDFPYIMAHTGGALLAVLERLDNGYRIFPACREHITKLPSEFAKKLYYDTTSFSGPLLRMAREIVGADRLLWGSDDPFIAADTEYVRNLGFPAQEEKLILGGNAARLLGLCH